MDSGERVELAKKVLAGYANGPDAPLEATSLALDKVENARAVILVEGISDQIAIETLALRRGRNLDAERVAVLPVGGAQAAKQYMQRFGPAGERLNLAGLLDADAAQTFRRALAEAGVGRPVSNAEMADMGFHICVRDLEDELIRAVGVESVLAVIESQGEFGALRTFQKQPEWKGQPLGAQLHRFFGSKARRSLRYARLLVEAVDLDRVPRPLDAVLTHVVGSEDMVTGG